MSRPKTKEKVLFEPHPKQTDYIFCTAEEVLYAGSVGSGKTKATLADIAKYLDRPHFVAVCVRRNYEELKKGVIKLAKELYDHKVSKLGGVYNGSDHMFKFPSGAEVWFKACEHDDDLLKFQGLEYNYLYIDELTQIPEAHFQYLKSRLRSSHGDPIIKRYTSNAGGPHHEWVFKYWENWLNPKHKYHLKSGQIARYKYKDEDGYMQQTTKSAVLCNIGDNPSVPKSEYEKQFIGMSNYMKKALWYNDWTAVPGSAEYFKRDCITLLASNPGGIVKAVRSYDLAGSEAKTADYTASIRLGLTRDNKIVVEDVYRARLSTDKVEKLILDNARIDGRGVKIVLPLEPAAAGKAWADKLSKLLHGYHFTFVPQNRASGGKVTRAMPVSAQCLKGNMSIITNAYSKEFLDELEAFTDDDTKYAHDDMVDALSQGYNELTRRSAGFRDLGMKSVSWTFGTQHLDPEDGKLDIWKK